MSERPPLRDLDVATGIVLGAPRGPGRLPRGSGTVVQALAASIRPALCRAPCVVAFSGGRDSSLVLAVATTIARQEGLDDPIPATNRFPHAPKADESAWQERVVAHLGLRDWVRLDHGDELDCVGPVATAALRRHGLLWPFNAHFLVPLLEAARGGALLTGIGGDELFMSVTRPAPAGRRATARRLAPSPLRRRLLERLSPAAFPWLSDAGLRAAARAAAAHDAYEPRTVGRRMSWTLRQRYMSVNRASLAALALDAGAGLHHPLSDPPVWAAMARACRGRFHADRTTAMRTQFPRLLPDDVLARTSKATFDGVFWGGPSRELAGAWDGGAIAVASHLVDPDRLREHWAGGSPWAQSYLLLQAVRLSATQRREGVGDRREDFRAARAAQAPDRV